MDALGGKTSTIYDADGQTVTAANELAGEGNTHKVRYVYDKMGRVIRRYNEDNTYVKYAYDKNGNVLSMTNERGKTYSYTYDKNNLLLTEKDPMGGVTAYTYPPHRKGGERDGRDGGRHHLHL